MTVSGLCTDCRDLPGESRRTHGERVLCERCAEKPYGIPSTGDPAEQLAGLLGLADVGVKVLGADIYGAGSRASVEIQLSNGETMTFDQLREMTQPNLLAAELVACTGAVPKLAKPIALKATALVRTIARTHRTMSDNDAARDWGAAYLQGAQVIDFDLNDQRDRWGAFSQLNEVEPSRDPIGLPPPNLVLRHINGTRLVRASWFGTYVRRIDSVSSREIPTRMSRVGWHRRGSEGRIKASRPGFRDTLQWSFYLVAEGWEADTATEPAGNGVTASGLVNARTQNTPLSRGGAVTDRYFDTASGVAA